MNKIQMLLIIFIIFIILGCGNERKTKTKENKIINEDKKIIDEVIVIQNDSNIDDNESKRDKQDEESMKFYELNIKESEELEREILEVIMLLNEARKIKENRLNDIAEKLNKLNNIKDRIEINQFNELENQARQGHEWVKM